MADVKQFKLPDVGEGLTEADIVSWKVKPGDSVSVNQVIVEIETAKSLVELPSPFDGVVTDLLVPEGQTVDVGTPIISVDVSGDAARGSLGRAEGAVPAGLTPAATQLPTTRLQGPGLRGDDLRSEALADDLVPRRSGRGRAGAGIEGSPAPKIERQAVLVGYGVKLGTTTRRQRKGEGEGRSDAGARGGGGGRRGRTSPALGATANLPGAGSGRATRVGTGGRWLSRRCGSWPRIWGWIWRR